MTRVDLRGREGVTLIELLIGLVIMGLVTTAAMRLIQQQDLAFSMGTSRMDALQNHRFAAETLERNLRAAGSNTADGQPFLVYIDPSTITINADYATRDPGDVFAVYVNPTAPVTETGSLTRDRRITIPGTGHGYPDSTYLNGAVPSSAETITFYFRADESTEREDDYVLHRQVNDLGPEIVSRGLHRLEGEPFFAYQEVLSGDTVTPRAEWVPRASLPLRHTVPMHLSAADTGQVARIDRVRAVRVAFGSAAGDGATAQEAPIRRVIRMPNAGRRSIRTCGEEPLFASGVAVAQPASEERLEVSWSAAFDEGDGERDVVRYAIFRRVIPEVAWGEPYFSIPAGQAAYVYSDGNVSAGSTYQYAVAAQDCTPTMSGLRISSEIEVLP